MWHEPRIAHPSRGSKMSSHSRGSRILPRDLARIQSLSLRIQSTLMRSCPMAGGKTVLTGHHIRGTLWVYTVLIMWEKLSRGIRRSGQFLTSSCSSNWNLQVHVRETPRDNWTMADRKTMTWWYRVVQAQGREQKIKWFRRLAKHVFQTQDKS